MTKEEFIKEIDICIKKDGHDIYLKFDSAKAIKEWIRDDCEDCVSRQSVIDMAGLSEWFDSSDSYNEFVIALSELPPVNPQRTGYWLHRENMDYLDKNKVIHNHFMCQDCGFIHDFIDGHTAQYKYCPNCGAKMEEMGKNG